MKICLFIGDHAADSLSVRMGAAITRKVQKGPYGIVTHCEAIHDEYSDGQVLIASSSIRDGGVRDKRVMLNPAHWWVVDVPQWVSSMSLDLFQRTRGAPYDLRGAVATVFLGSPKEGCWFCSEWVAQPYIKASATFSPSQFSAICLSLGKDVTAEFFAERA